MHTDVFQAYISLARSIPWYSGALQGCLQLLNVSERVFGVMNQDGEFCGVHFCTSYESFLWLCMLYTGYIISLLMLTTWLNCLPWVLGWATLVAGITVVSHNKSGWQQTNLGLMIAPAVHPQDECAMEDAATVVNGAWNRNICTIREQVTQNLENLQVLCPQFNLERLPTWKRQINLGTLLEITFLQFTCWMHQL